MQDEKLQNIEEIKFQYEEIVKRQECVSLKDLAISGSDLIAAGMEPGKEIGEILNKLLELVIESPDLNQKDKLLEIKDTL